MELKRLDRGIYAGRKFTVRYRTGGYYDIRADEHGFRMEYTPFASPVERTFDDVFFGDWLEEPTAFGAFEGGRLLGFAEGSPESWNNRFRISNICIFDESRRRCGLGTLLMEAILQTAESTGARMAVLETQSCNENAIAFYKRSGFDIIGLDLYSYSNHDPERHEVRLEMGRRLK